MPRAESEAETRAFLKPFEVRVAPETASSFLGFIPFKTPSVRTFMAGCAKSDSACEIIFIPVILLSLTFMETVIGPLRPSPVPKYSPFFIELSFCLQPAIKKAARTNAQIKDFLRKFISPPVITFKQTFLHYFSIITFEFQKRQKDF